jgi:hypothetical protein
VAADPAALAVVGHEDHGGAVELPVLVQERQELADAPVRLGELAEVLGAPHAAHVAELVGGEQLQDEQVRILLVHHPPRLGAQRVVDFSGRLHRRHRTNHLVAERVQQMGDPDKPAATPLALEHVED